ncbi:MAG TPA: RNA 2',3'-cyclic phosphodiesterase [Herpetosiphon sp.]|uniref:RNA 2',3'-cyclic phosphodiesterase n=1 Tax=Herpetosiphon aurantiacus (strain ATCC 23779 / DSM 785 / 114-95) TaxID=316274 RepID=A9B5P6_HERA2|nr:RNA 2',3'-cyclic phosphodiesterase [Herpetosiphon sp.]ABX04279.1 2'-5' RNA ligase [Herpetosiphon aurantiacus DSM 785]HBW52602.1 RNA 2',3'-cyclic phosphodiesterase [Herpetosiphon sp.]
MSEQWRCFMALDLPEPIQAQLLAIQAELQQLGLPIRWSKPENLHLTLQFLGNLAVELLPDLQTKLNHALTQQTAPTLNCNTWGYFPNASQPQVVWAGFEQWPNDLLQLQQAVVGCSSHIGIIAETRPWHPHITLGYSKERLTKHQIEQLSSQLQASQWPATPAIYPTCQLIRSISQPQASSYQTLVTWQLNQAST